MTVFSNSPSEGQALAALMIFLGSYLVFALGKFPGMKIDRPGAGIHWVIVGGESGHGARPMDKTNKAELPLSLRSPIH